MSLINKNKVKEFAKFKNVKDFLKNNNYKMCKLIIDKEYYLYINDLDIYKQLTFNKCKYNLSTKYDYGVGRKLIEMNGYVFIKCNKYSDGKYIQMILGMNIKENKIYYLIPIFTIEEFQNEIDNIEYEFD